MEFVKFAYELKNMLLHICRLEAKATPKRPAIKASGCKSRERSARRVEDIIGKGYCGDEDTEGRRLCRRRYSCGARFRRLLKVGPRDAGQRTGVVLGEADRRSG